MRLTEFISFLQKNPTGDDVDHYTHIDVSAMRGQMLLDKEFGKFVRKHRKEYKNGTKK
jgi:hypothetical protein